MHPVELAEAFARHGVAYCIVGGVAATLHGVLRDTFDLDVLVSPAAENLRRASLAMAELGMAPHVPVKLEDLADPEVRRRLREEKNLLALGYVDPASPLRRVDVLLDGPFEVDDVIARAVVRGGARVIGLADLIAMKRAAGRPRDLDDADWLERLERER
mgnify:CR=1 FL=1